MKFSEWVVENYSADSKAVFPTDSIFGLLEKFLIERYGPFLFSEHPSSFHEQRGKLCGYAFERGDLVYRCRNCGRDPTCVLCANCFKYQDHVGHEIFYNITSHSGGCCDCGDSEAWHKTLNCSLHHSIEDSSSALTDGDPPALVLTDDEKEISQEILFVLIDLFLLGIIEDHPEIDASLFIGSLPKDETLRNLGILLYNDEEHSFEEVITILSETLGCDREIGRIFAETVDRHGRALVYSDDSSCNSEKRSKIVKDISDIDLTCREFPSFYIFYQECACFFLTWLVDSVSASSWLQRVISKELCQKIGDSYALIVERLGNSAISFKDLSSLTYVELLLCSDKFLWKTPRVAFKELLMNTMLKSYEWKLHLAELFSRSYYILLDQFLNEDREPDLSILFFSVQLYTVPSVVKFLVTERDLIRDILGSIKVYFGKDISQGSNYNLKQSFIVNRRYFHPFQDIRYLLDGCSCDDVISSDFKHPQNPAFRYFVAVLSLFEGMNTNERALVDHVEYENEDWIHAFNLSLQTSRLAREIGLFFSKDSLSAGVNTLKFIVSLMLDKDFFTAPIKFTIVSWEAGSFSFHHPLHWLIAHLIRGIVAQNGFLSVDQYPGIDLSSFFSQNSAISLCLQVYLSQIRAGMWVRNGYSLKSQVQNYFSPMLLEDMRDQDYFILQYNMVWNKGSALQAIFEQYDIWNWCARSDTEDKAIFHILSEDLLHLLIDLMSLEIFRIGVVDKDLVELFVIQALFVEPNLSHSDLVKKLPTQFSENTEILDDVIKKVAQIKRKREKEYFVLNDNYSSRIDIFFPYYSATNRHTCIDLFLKPSRKRYGLYVTPKLTKVVDVYLESGELFDFIFAILLHIIALKEEFESLLVCILYLLCACSSYRADILYRLISEDRKLKFSLPGNQQATHTSIRMCLQLISQSPMSGRLAHLLENILAGEPNFSWSEKESPRGALDVDSKNIGISSKDHAEMRRKNLVNQFQAAQKNFCQNSSTVQDDGEDEENIEITVDKSPVRTSLKSLALGEVCVVCRESVMDGKYLCGFMCDLNQIGINRAFCMEPGEGRHIGFSSDSSESLSNRARISQTEDSNRPVYLLNSDWPNQWKTVTRNAITCCKHIVHHHCFRQQENEQESLISSLLERLLAGEAMFDFGTGGQLSKCPVCRKRVRSFLPTLFPVSSASPKAAWLDINRETEISHYFMTDNWYIFWNAIHSTMTGNNEADVTMSAILKTYELGVDFERIPWSGLANLVSDLLENCEIFMRSFSGSEQDEYIINSEVVFLGLYQLIRYSYCQCPEKIFKEFASEVFSNDMNISRGPLRTFVNTSLLRWNPESVDDLDDIRKYALLLLGNYLNSLHNSNVSLGVLDEIMSVNNINENSTTQIVNRLSENYSWSPKYLPILSLYASIFLRQIMLFCKFFFKIVIPFDLSDAAIIAFLGLDDQDFSKLCIMQPVDIVPTYIVYPFHFRTIALPVNYDTLVSQTLKIACSRCKKIPSETAICLLCGALCCAQSYCCISSTSQGSSRPNGTFFGGTSGLTVGECNLHMLVHCGWSCGIFLLVQKGVILLLSSKGKGCFRPSPYIDVHGESDLGLRRGSPLFLDAALQNYLEYLWLSLGIPRAIDSTLQEENNFNPRLWLSM